MLALPRGIKAFLQKDPVSRVVLAGKMGRGTLIYAYFLLHGKSLPLEFRHACVVDPLATSPASVINYPRKTTQGRKLIFLLALIFIRQGSQGSCSQGIYNQ